MDYLDDYRYFVLSHRKLWLSIFGSNRKFSVRVLRFSVILLKIEIFTADQEKILALLASWSFHQKTTAKHGNFSIEMVPSITK